VRSYAEAPDGSGRQPILNPRFKKMDGTAQAGDTLIRPIGGRSNE